MQVFFAINLKGFATGIQAWRRMHTLLSVVLFPCVVLGCWGVVWALTRLLNLRHRRPACPQSAYKSGFESMLQSGFAHTQTFAAPQQASRIA